MGIIPHGYFVAKPFTIGSSDEEMAAAARGEVSVERMTEIRERMHHEMYVLSERPIEGSG